jgi:serine/threonine-protein kinase
LHFAGIIHRDIKPFNLMLTSDDRIKIIDFGLSRVRGEDKTAIPGMQVGSPYYAAPEQEKNPRLTDGRADLFSLGVMGYRMLTGQLVDRRQGKILPPSTLNAELGPDWDACIMKSMAGNPAHRYASALEMRLGVEALSLASPNLNRTGKERSCWVQGIQPVRKVVRKEPCRVMYKDIRQLLGLDELLRPLRYTPWNFTVIGRQLALEKNSGLYWQRRGSGFTLDWRQAKEYVSHLNSINWQGRNSWRLPTLDEARTILSPPLHGVRCSGWPLFDDTIHWLWTSDHCTGKQAWMVDVVESFFDRLDKDGVASVCAVSSAL